MGHSNSKFCLFYDASCTSEESKSGTFFYLSTNKCKAKFKVFFTSLSVNKVKSKFGTFLNLSANKGKWKFGAFLLHYRRNTHAVPL